MNDHPILFSSEMVRAILAGRKTQTRRTLRDQPHPHLIPLMSEDGSGEYKLYTKIGRIALSRTGWIKCPYGSVGDILWVRETFCMYPMAGNDGAAGQLYRADKNITDEAVKRAVGGWRPSIHMPRWAARIFLKITNIRIEKIQDISIEDIEAEGIIRVHSNSMLDQFEELWNSINKKRGYGWEVNPWVWVVEFEKKRGDNEQIRH